MFFTLQEIVKWLGMTVFEIWLNIVTLIIFSVLAILKGQDAISFSWWKVFIPLFLCDGLCAYFCIIVFVRTYKARDLRGAGVRLLSSVVFLVCLFVFKLLFCQKLSNENKLSYSEVFASLFVALQILMVRACQVY